MNYHKIEKTSVANGTGVRTVLWVSGCSLHCKGCHNPETWDLNSGLPFNDAARQEFFEALGKPYIQGCTFSGGHPLEKENMAEVYKLIRWIKEYFPDKDIWLYTGYQLRYENFDGTDDECFWVDGDEPIVGTRSRLLKYCDVVVDGPYIEEQRDITLKFRGSRNQRLIDVKETLKQGKIITVQN
jgi:anaerobic ribonucleoside-triphosphate reductase activating protein